MFVQPCLMPITTLNTAAMARMSRRMSHSQPYCGSSAHSVQTISIATMQTARMTRDLIMCRRSGRSLLFLFLDLGPPSRHASFYAFPSDEFRSDSRSTENVNRS